VISAFKEVIDETLADMIKLVDPHGSYRHRELIELVKHLGASSLGMTYIENYITENSN